MELIDELLKSALYQVALEDMKKFPTQEELIERYPISKRFDRKMIKIIREEGRLPFTRSLIRFSKRAAMFFLALLITAFTTIMSVQAAREWLIRVITGIFNTHTEIVLEQEEKAKEQLFLRYLPESLPEGYVLKSQDINDIHKRSMLVYEKENDSCEMKITQFGRGRMKLDTEGAQMRNVRIWGEEAIYAEKKDRKMLLWTDSLYQYYIVATDENLDQDDLLAVADSMRMVLPED